jgi:hypothetical protein
MKNIFRKKNGEITSQQIVILVIVIVSFAVILFFLFRLNLGETSDDELCHNSVVTRGSAVIPSDAVPLNCHRKYICITKSGGTCQGLTNPERIEVKSLDEIYKAIADQMANCWWMFGEGRINYVGGKLEKNNYCSICSQVYFDKSLESITGNTISKDKLYDFLKDNKIDETNSYLDYLIGTNDLASIKKESSEKNDVNTFGILEIGKQYFVIMGITSDVSLWNWAGLGAGGGSVLIGGAVVSALVFGTTPVGWIAGIAVIGVITGVGTTIGSIKDTVNPEIAIISVNGRGIDNKFMAPTIVEVNSEKFNALNCEEILTLA